MGVTAAPRISVIVPVYRAQEYLADCVNSLLAQTFQDFELLLVDDGSPDECPRLCEAFAQKDSRIRVIHQDNQGVSAARNTGIEAAAVRFWLLSMRTTGSSRRFCSGCMRASGMRRSPCAA